MPRADKRYTAGLMERLHRTVPNTEGRAWIIDEGSTTYGRWWRVCEAEVVTNHLGQSGPWRGHYAEIAYGRTEYDMQQALAHYLDGYTAGRAHAFGAIATSAILDA